jgi:hypothetical protein
MIFITFLFFSSIGYSQIPNDVFGVNNIIKIMNQPFINKMVQLKQNLVEEVDQNVIRFFDTKGIVCPLGSKVLPRQSSVEIKYNKIEAEDSLIEEIQFFGCNQNANFSIELSREGKNLSPIGSTALRSFDFSLEILNAETVREYNVKINSGSVFKVYQENRNNIKLSEFYFSNNKILGIEQRTKNNLTEIQYVIYPFIIEINHNQYRYRQKSGEVIKSMIVNFNSNLRSLEFLDYNRQPISLAQYQKVFNDDVLFNLIDLNTNLFNAIDKDMPTTQFVNSGLANATLIEELRIIQGLLLSNTQLNVVQNYIQEYLKAAQNGQLEDRRPKKNGK